MLRIISILSLVAGLLSSLIIVIDILAGHKQHMWVMNIVWPMTALYSGPLGVWVYYRLGRLSTKRKARQAKELGQQPLSKRKPFWQSVLIGATHCGSGCSLGDIFAEWLIYLVPLTLFGRRVFAAWTIDYVLAFLFGIAFQYFTIKPMRSLSVKEALISAVKADALSLTAWQVGMYGWMALIIFVVFKQEIPKTEPLFWFMMQIAMLAGFFTSYPVNWWLLKKGIKEAM